ncbi:hypothetical protein JMJ77_0007572, partial [Colletotrichum scovillei]
PLGRNHASRGAWICDVEPVQWASGWVDTSDWSPLKPSVTLALPGAGISGVSRQDTPAWHGLLE